MDTVEKILQFLFRATIVAAVLYVVSNTYGLLTADFTSFPWWSAAMIGLYYFGPLLLLEGLALLGVRYWKKRHEE